jgi:hypothetical protein
VTVCPPCPSPIDPAFPPIWAVDLGMVTIHGDSAGSGCLSDLSDLVATCMRGTCGRQPYRRKARHITDFASDCVEQWCEIVDEDGPTYSDVGPYEITGCQLFTNPAPPPDPPVNIWYAETCKRITNVPFCASTAPPNGIDPLFSLIEVRYTWPGDSFPLVDLDCATNQTFTATVGPQQWTCIYAKKLTPGQYFATGQYRLMVASWPGAETTHDDQFGFCVEDGGSVCRPTYDAPWPGGIQSTWKPPETITVYRVN